VSDFVEPREFLGGCLCGDVRYRATRLIDAGYCHCRLCQRSSGAPVLAWATFEAGSFAYFEGRPGRYASSDRGAREFCRECGTQIAFHDARTPDRIDLNIGSLDDPSAVKPQYHIWMDSKLPWFDLADDLPRYAEAGPDSPTAPPSKRE
jgi:hypothetical protein